LAFFSARLSRLARYETDAWQEPTATNRRSIIALAARHRLPAVYPLRYFAASGDVLRHRRGRGVFARGRLCQPHPQPGDLPVQASRPAKVGDKLTTHHFNTGTRGFAAPEDANTAVCVLPGTELAFAKEVGCRPRSLLGWKASTVNHTTAIFRQISKDDPRTHHDALEFPDGQIVLLTDLFEDQEATVLQLPAQPATAAEAAAQERVALVG